MSAFTYDKNARYSPSTGYFRVASLCPKVKLGDSSANAARILELYRQAADVGAALAVFPELCITGYTLGDTVQSAKLLDSAMDALLDLAGHTEGVNCAAIVGLPVRVADGLYNCGAVISGGKIRGLVPKTHLPTYGEFYENRWFESHDGDVFGVRLGGDQVPFGPRQLFDIGGVLVGIEICEDLWVADPPSTRLVKNGALVICNPSASPEQIAKESYRLDMVKVHSGRLLAAYVYSGCDTSESTSEIVMGGHQIIASSYSVLAEKKPFSPGEAIMADIDIDHLSHDRRRQHFHGQRSYPISDCQIVRATSDILFTPSPSPFLPLESGQERSERLAKAFNIQAAGLAQRLAALPGSKVVLGLSGGLDSTLAALVACRAASMLGRDRESLITAITMPGPASSQLTQSNSVALARALGLSSEVIGISEMTELSLKMLSHDSDKDVTYENIQARARTYVLFNWANKHNAIVLGTGDLSELALGWCTYNGDQQSHYNVNASLPKTYIRSIVEYLREQPDFGPARDVLRAILDTPITPELVKDEGDEITQNTEDIVGPYELHDFFLYYFVRFFDTPEKIAFLAGKAFAGKYDPDTIDKWLATFLWRFRTSQFKRDTMPNGPKVGAVSLSPRGDWRMPSDMP